MRDDDEKLEDDYIMKLIAALITSTLIMSSKKNQLQCRADSLAASLLRVSWSASCSWTSLPTPFMPPTTNPVQKIKHEKVRQVYRDSAAFKKYPQKQYYRTLKNFQIKQTSTTLKTLQIKKIN
jgi:hypothetical protein